MLHSISICLWGCVYMCVCLRFANVARFKTCMFAKLVYVARSISLNESDDNGGGGGGVLVKFDVKWGDMSKERSL